MRTIVGVMAPNSLFTHSPYLFLLLSHIELLGAVLKGLYIPLSLWLLNNLKPCFKGVEGVLDYYMHAHTVACLPVRSGLGVRRPAASLLIFWRIFFELFTYKLS